MVPADRSRFSAAAFSLIELMLVLAMIGVFSAMAAPRYADALNRYRADAAIRRVAADLALVQARARAAGSSRTVSFDLAKSTYKIAGERDINRSTDTYSVDLSIAPYYVSLGSASFGGSPAVTFNGYGLPDNAGTVQIQKGSVVRTVTIEVSSGAMVVK